MALPNMPKRYPHKIVKSTRLKTELSQFASWFHQDWKLVFDDFQAGATLYLKSLPESRKEILRSELSAFLEVNSEKSLGELKQSWLALGAQGWPADLNIRDALGDFVLML